MLLQFFHPPPSFRTFRLCWLSLTYFVRSFERFTCVEVLTLHNQLNARQRRPPFQRASGSSSGKCGCSAVEGRCFHISFGLRLLAANICPTYSKIESIHSKHEVEHLQVYQDRECVRNWQLYFYPSLSCEPSTFEFKMAFDHFEVSVGSSSRFSRELSES